MTKDEFIEKIVFGYIKRDLERMLTEIRPLPNMPGNINFPLALCVLAYMDYLGGYLRGHDSNDFACHAETYIRSCFSSPSVYLPNINILKDIFRNGLAHDYFARGGISRNGGIPLYRDGQVILDAETLTKDFIKSLFKFKDELKEPEYEARGKEADKKFKDRNNNTIIKREIDKLPTLASIVPEFPSNISGPSLYPRSLPDNIKTISTTSGATSEKTTTTLYP